MTVATHYSITDVGKEQLGGVFLGNTVARQTVRTQFVMDVAAALNVSYPRLKVLRVEAGYVHHSWIHDRVLFTFRLAEANGSFAGEPGLVASVSELTALTQNTTGGLFAGKVTRRVDKAFGAFVHGWDASLRLRFALPVVGAVDALDPTIISGGSERRCLLLGDTTPYCEFELMFRQDIAEATGVALERISVQFVKHASRDSVLVHFRIAPGFHESTTAAEAFRLLREQTRSLDSPLLRGNVTVRTDSTWGLSGEGGTARSLSPVMGSAIRNTTADEHLRARDTLRTTAGFAAYDPELVRFNYSYTLFRGGQQHNASVFSDFEDRRGAAWGWTRNGSTLPPGVDAPVPGAHVSSFSMQPAGALELDNATLQVDVDASAARAAALRAELVWLRRHAETLTLDVAARSRADSRAAAFARIHETEAALGDEEAALAALSASQCRQPSTPCEIVVNTSSLEIYGAASARGVARNTTAGTSVAVFVFEHIALGPELNVTVLGDRGLVLVSRSSAVINTTVAPLPGACGGFPGGGPATTFNANGPGSSNHRVYVYDVQTHADVAPEVQLVKTTARAGQQLGGSFRLRFGGLTTAAVPHDASPRALKRAIEADLGPALGAVRVTRSHRGDDQGGFEWRVTMESFAGGDPAPLEPLAAGLTGVDANVSVSTPEPGNAVGGSFRLRFGGAVSRQLAHTASAADVEAALLELDAVAKAHVARSNSSGQARCDGGLCADSPGPGATLRWTVQLATDLGNPQPRSLSAAPAYEEGRYYELIPEYVGTLTGAGANVTATLLDVASVAYGGTGGAYALAEDDDDLVGGSGGAAGEPDALAAMAAQSLYRHRNMGGHGGAALELVAHTDIVVGSAGALDVSGGDGAHGRNAGGGGSGGRLVLAAGGMVVNEGALRADGGRGGHSVGTVDGATGASGGGGGGGRVLVTAQSWTGAAPSVAGGSAGDCGAARACGAAGADGVATVSTALGLHARVDPGQGALGTGRALRLFGHLSQQTASAVDKEAAFTRNGVEHLLGADNEPGRVTAYVRLGDAQRAGRDWGAHVALGANDSTTLVGVTLREGMFHDANFAHRGGADRYGPQQRFFRNVELERWYKLDIVLNWGNRTYSVLVDNSVYVSGAPFAATEGVHHIGLYSFNDVDVWFDEVFVGRDHSLGFQCPAADPRRVRSSRPDVQHLWDTEDEPHSHFFRETKHASHLSRRTVYQYDNGGLVPNDGSNHVKFSSDVPGRYDIGQRRDAASDVGLGGMTWVPGNARSERARQAAATTADPDDLWTSGADEQQQGASGRYYWYAEHRQHDAESGLYGGIGACSTADFVHWRYEGFSLLFNNVSDQVEGTAGQRLTAARPRVLHNAMTGQYVMWVTLDGVQQAGVAVSESPSGPFQFVRSLFPDGNETVDSTLFQTANGTAFLARSYYAETEYVLPQAVMQPMWESVKLASGDIDFGLNYQRARYDDEYADFHDVYMQRWRQEDIGWEIVCVSYATGANRSISRDEFMNDGDTCAVNTEYKIVVGQGVPVVETRYKDPEAEINNVWKPDSVPGVRAQPWLNNVRDGTCGIAPLDQNLDRTDPLIESRSDVGYDTCSNIADNPIHKTPPDQLIGENKVAQTRRAKFVAISRLTDDYLDTTGQVAVVEGTLEDREQLAALIGDFSWSSSTSGGLGSTFAGERYSEYQMSYDWDDRFNQYVNQYNDRALYSVSCSLDEECPVNFADQLVEGHYAVPLPVY